MSKLRWNPYVLYHGPTATSFWKDHFTNRPGKLLFILGKGFDVRMNIAIESLIKACPAIDVDCWLIEYNEGKDSSSHDYKAFVEENMAELSDVLKEKPVVIKKIDLWSKGPKRLRIGDRQAAGIINSFSDIAGYTDIIVDISALPRGIYFSLIGKILFLIDKLGQSTVPNLLITVAENAKLDALIKEESPDNDPGFPMGFGGDSDLTSEEEKPVIWFPILGEDKKPHLEKAYTRINPNEICPVLPFPAKDPRRSDALIIDYHQLLFDEFRIESQNIMYVPEQNPFEAYSILTKAIKNYYRSLNVLNGCKAIISAFSSKLLSIGALMAAHELLHSEKISVGILNVDSQGYRIDELASMKNFKDESELFVIWLTGEPYTTE
jgi:hypothetical protein